MSSTAGLTPQEEGTQDTITSFQQVYLWKGTFCSGGEQDTLAPRLSGPTSRSRTPQPPERKPGDLLHVGQKGLSSHQVGY